MRNITPKIVAPIVRVAEDQPEYTPVDVIQATHQAYRLAPKKTFNSVVMAFELSLEERRKLLRGEALYVSLLTFGYAQTPILLTVGPEEMAIIHGLKVDDTPPKEPVLVPATFDWTTATITPELKPV